MLDKDKKEVRTPIDSAWEESFLTDNAQTNIFSHLIWSEANIHNKRIYTHMKIFRLSLPPFFKKKDNDQVAF